MKKKIKLVLGLLLIFITSTPIFSQGPGEPYHPMTANGSRHIHRVNNQYFAHKLFWENPPSTTYNDIFLSQDSSLIIALDSSALILSGYDSFRVFNNISLSLVGTLEHHTKYYWCVVEHNESGLTIGPIWYFISENWQMIGWNDDFSNGLSNYTPQPNNGLWSVGYSSNAGGTAPELVFYNLVSGNSYLILNDFFDLSPDVNPLSFNYCVQYAFGEFTVGFAYSLDEGVTWTPFWQQVVTENIPATHIYGELVPNENYIKLALFCSSSNSLGMWYVDNLTINSPLTIPTPPGQIQALADTSNLRVFLNWSAGFGIDPITGYKIQRKIGLPTSSSPYQTLVEVGPYTLTFEDSEVQPNTIYTYRIQTKLWGGSGVTAWSNEATAYVPNIVPVELQSFTAEVIGSEVTLLWSTATETNNHGFEIHRSAKNENASWEKIGFVPGFGTITEVHHYTFVDESVQSGTYQYRLKQIDFDGSFEYSNNIEVAVDAPIEFSLEQNYPNPFNPLTSIQYVVGSQNYVTLKVFDVLGNEVATLVNEEKPPGNYEAEFTVGQDSSPDISSGIYFYQLKAGSFIETKKMILLK